jgi:hypothetical protein
MADSVSEMLDDLRTHRPQIYQADEYATWEAAIVQALAAFPKERQWAAVVLVANDLTVAMPGMPLPMAYGHLCGKLRTYQERVRS